MTTSLAWNEFLTWYRAQMSACFRLGTQRHPFGRDFVVLHFDTYEHAVRVTRWHDDIASQSETLELDDASAKRMLHVARTGRTTLPVLIAIAERDMLETRLSLPNANPRDLRDMMTFEVERLTPFSADEMFWTATVVRHQAETHRMIVALACTPKAPLQRILSWLADHDVSVRALVASPDGREADPATWSQIDIAPPHKSAVLKRTGLALATLAVLVGATFWRQHHDLATLDHAMAALRPDVAMAQAMRARYDELVSGPAILNRKGAESRANTSTLRTLSELMPDSSYLSELTIRGQRIELIGLAPSAAALLEQLDRGGFVHDPAFDGPVTRSSEGTKDMFTLQASLAPVAPAGALAPHPGRAPHAADPAGR